MATAPPAHRVPRVRLQKSLRLRPRDHPSWTSTRSALRYYPFTLLGTALLVAAVYLAGSAFATNNSYEFLLSTVASVVLAVLVIDGRLQACRLAAVNLSWNTEQPLSARAASSLDLKAAGTRRPHYFFRLHARFTGRLHAGNQAVVHLRAEVSSASAELPLSLDLPVCGDLEVRVRLAVHDVFGLTRSHLPRRDERRLLPVRPASQALRSAPKLDAALGDDSARRRRSSDEERYYMREYEPGDRLKDINWKASSRLNELITRISPVSEQQTRLLHVELRHYRLASPETLDSVLHLDYLKSWLLAFLRSVKADHKDFTFRVITGEGEHYVDTVDDIDELSKKLTSVTFAPAPDYRLEVHPHELFVFTTAFDAGLTTHVAQLGDTAVHVYRTVSAISTHTEDDNRIRHALPLVSPSLVPGAWALRRERFMLGPSIRGSNVHIEDQPLEVSLS